MGRLAGLVTAMHGLSRERIVALVRASRTAQGLPERITDPLVLRDVSVLLASVIKPRPFRAQPKVA